MAGVSVCLKYSMFIFNFLFWLCGILILAVAIWIRASKDKQEVLGAEDSGSSVSLSILIAVGAIIMILGFLGCCGAIKESRFMLLLFFIGLLLILLLQVTSGILAASLKPESDRILNETLHENAQLLSEQSEKGKKVQKAIIEIQHEYKCCGLINGAADWGKNFEQAYESCKCSSPQGDSCTTYDGRYVHKETCSSFVKDLVSEHVRIIIGLSFGLAAIEILGMVFSMVLYCQIGSK